MFSAKKMNSVTLEQRLGGRGAEYCICDRTAAGVWIIVPRADIRIVGARGIVTMESVDAKLPVALASQKQLRAAGHISGGKMEGDGHITGGTIKPSAYAITQHDDGLGTVVRINNTWGQKSKSFTGSFVLAIGDVRVATIYAASPNGGGPTLPLVTHVMPPVPPPTPLALAMPSPLSQIDLACQSMDVLTQPAAFDSASLDDLVRLQSAATNVLAIIDTLLAPAHGHIMGMDELNDLLK